MSEPIRAVRGMNDILPDEAERWEALEELLRDWLRSYGYRNVRTPVLEHTALFAARSARPPISSRRRCTPSPTS